MPVTDLAANASIGLVRRVPGGTLRLGSRFHPREQPRRGVYVAEFEMAHTAVTVSQYGAFLESGAARQARWWSPAGWAWRQGEAGEGWGREDRHQPEGWETQRRRPYHPLVGVTWYEAEASCAWLGDQKKRAVRLPTEAEWERAARGDDDRPFPWGETFSAALTNTLESGLDDTVPAASLTGDASPYGLLEMGGNVQEWTSSHYTARADETYADERLYVARGGSFNDTAYGARTSYRRAYPPGYFFPFLGFRVAVTFR